MDISSRWSAPGYRPHYFGPLWILWRLGLAPSKRQGDLLLLFIIVASSAWTYFIIFGVVGNALLLDTFSTELSVWQPHNGRV